MHRESQRHITDDAGLNTGVWPTPAGQLITPVEQFFTRSHAAVPRIDRDAWRLRVGGLVARSLELSYADVIAYPRHEVAATLLCAGLRREEFLAMGPLPGELPWGPEPVSTGVWSGARLHDVLRDAGVDRGARHVEFVGLDDVERHGHHFGFGGSVDMDKAMTADVLIATHLNGEPLPASHGFPARAMVPGWIGARSVKWLGSIRVLDEPSTNYFQTRAYRTQRDVNPADPRDVSAGVALAGIPLNSVIVEPTRGERVAAGAVRVHGWATGNAGCRVAAVEISSDAGATWQAARITQSRGAWTWCLWEATVDLSRGKHILVVRASDESGATQPPDVRATWNVKGYCNNVWHRVDVAAV
ncbi:MAG TPA: sulfite oxidase [Gemmatimonadaceae bacterium]|nr:sulfite oxidase [Gemmatimonadaceae bacterium]